MSEIEVNHRLKSIPYATVLGMEARFSGDKLQFILPFKEDNIGNPMLYALHGGCIGGFMEMAAIAQLMYSLSLEKFPKPIGINVDYLRRGDAEDTFAEAELVKSGKRVANLQVRAWQKDYAKPIATLHAHFLIDER